MGNVIELFGDSTSTVSFDDGTVSTTGELVDDARRVATWLHGTGIRRGDRVAIRLPNSADGVRLLLACAVGGFVGVSVNPRYSDAEADELVQRSGARWFPTGVWSDAWTALDPAPLSGTRDDGFVVFTTSGTTSRPKMVLHLQASIADHAADAAIAFGYCASDTVLVAMPLCGTFGLTSFTAAVAGSCAIVVTEFELERTAGLIAARRISCVNGSDDMFHRLLVHGADLSSVRLAGHARFNTSLDGIVDRGADAGATLTGLYGMSEVQALFSLRDPSGDATQRARAGGTVVSADAQLRVVDGELQLQGPSLFAGYLAEGGDQVDHELTARHFEGDWFRTGDLAEVDDHDPRTFEYVARMGDVLRLGGFLVGPAEIEAALMSIEHIVAAQVVAVDRPGGARPVAFVVLEPSIASGAFDETAAIEACRERLARYKVPVRVLPIDVFPTTPSANGTKIQKVKLREIAERELG